VARIDFTWTETGTHKPAVKERLLLMLANAEAAKPTSRSDFGTATYSGSREGSKIKHTS
jgi:hypothetical protein